MADLRLIVIAVTSILAATDADAADLSGSARVIDGDTIAIGEQRIRLSGVDAPEKKQVCRRDGQEWRAGADATAWLKDRLENQTVTCTDEGHDRYKRIIGTCFVGGEDINGALVRAGWAVAYRRYSERYVAEEAKAKAEGLGIWGAECETPEVWRRAK